MHAHVIYIETYVGAYIFMERWCSILTVIYYVHLIIRTRQLFQTIRTVDARVTYTKKYQI